MTAAAGAQPVWSPERTAKLRGLIRQLYSVVAALEEEFEGRKFTPDGHLVGSIGEVVAAYAFGLNLLPASSEGHDAVAPDGRRVQIKLTGGTRGVSLYCEPDHLIVLQLTASREFKTIYNGRGQAAWKVCGREQKNGQRSVSLSALNQVLVKEDEKLEQVRDFPLLADLIENTVIPEESSASTPQ
jgi:hypothetical protein